ncbi:MAG: SDR family oxidoreductase [Minwuia sp.]|uniref:SDR family oxidoreductase n=1 Tax=Minwuia sp. TaxID=2493630 RepID=UPI003A88F848
MRGLKGKTIIVTGGASGIGRALSGRLAEEGAKVAIFDLNGDGAKTAAGEIGNGAGGYALDITDHAAVVAAVEQVEADMGPIEGLVNNAGWDKMVPFLKSDPELWKKIVDINLFGPVNVTHAVLSKMAERGGGRIVSVASDAGRVGSTGEGVYSYCKGGVIAFMKTLAREHAKQGITCNTVCPGPTETPLFAGFDPEGKIKAALERSIPLRRLGQPEDYPGMIAFLLSDDAAFITGQVISVSGGLTMNG